MTDAGDHDVRVEHVGNARRVLVVGAASGIGAAAAAWLSRRGWDVVAADVDAAHLHDPDVLPPGVAGRLEVDVRDESSVTQAVTEAERQLGGLDALLNCVGTTGGGWCPVTELSVDHLDALYRVNLRGAFLLTRTVLPAMQAKGHGRILHVASIAGKEGVAGMSTYCATKAGLIGLVKSVAREVATDGITVNALAPAIINTALTESLPPEQYDHLVGLTPMGRPGDLDEVSAMVEWALSPQCSFTTGFVFDLSGGRADY